MNEIFQLVALCLTGGVASLVGAGIIILVKEKYASISEKLTAFAAGVLISVGLLDLLKESLEHANDIETIPYYVLGGLLFVFLLEKSGLWFHHHDGDHGRRPSILGVLSGDMIHNFIDGFAIGAAFLIDSNAGIMTAMAVAMHELPKEMADFMVYLRAGYSNLKTIGLNLISSVVAVIGGLSAYAFGDFVESHESGLLAITAGMFLFIALSDLVPEMHEEMEKVNRKSKLVWLFIFVLGLGVGIVSSSSH
jgi:zinc and cadmium transporter